jgi:multidrug efflux pump subunit AcrA (membrane-fusion protein)
MTPSTVRSCCRLLILAPLALGAAGCDRAVTPGAAAASADAVANVTAVTVRPRDFVRRVRLTGLTEATQSYVVTTPLLAGETRGSLVITKLAAAGTAVKKGDLLVQFDSQEQDKTALDKKAEYEDLVQQIRQKRAEQDAARVKDDSELVQARNAVKKFELEILKNEMLSRVLAEKNDQDLAEARSKLTTLTESFELKRAAAHAELRILEIRRDRAMAAMEHALENSRGMMVRSPLDGLVVPKLTWRGNGPADIQEGDEMRPGAPVLQVVNQASMQVRARVNQADVPLVRAGMPVTVRLDAYPDLEMPGTIAQVAPIGVPGSFSPRVRAFAAVVTIAGSNARLLPDLTAAIDVELERTKGALVVPWSAVSREGDKASVRVREGDGVATRAVTLGPSDEVDVVVTSGLAAGQVVMK